MTLLVSAVEAGWPVRFRVALAGEQADFGRLAAGAASISSVSP